jgi:hypothetical protein
MPALKFWDAASGTYKEILSGQKGEKGDKGDKGDQGVPGGFGPLDQLTDVSAPANTPVNKVLGTTAIGTWGPIDPPPTGLQQADADLRYVNVTGDESMAGSLTVGGNIITGTGAVRGLTLESNGGVRVAGKATQMTAPTAVDDGANKAYVDGRIWSGTQAQYNAIVTKDPTVLYVIVA